MTKHTPGPWIAPAASLAVFAHGYDCRICDIRGWGYFTGAGGMNLSPDQAAEIQDANRRLISAAPELLEALQEALLSLEVGLETESELEAEWSARDRVLVSKIRAAIAKATGNE